MFSRPDPKRLNANAERIYLNAGNTATWQQFVSAVDGNPVAGLGSAVYYREQTLTAHFGMGMAGGGLPTLMENIAAPGQIAAGMVPMTSREKIGRQDQIVWRGTTYRVESDPIPAHIVGWWITMLKRGNE